MAIIPTSGFCKPGGKSHRRPNICSACNQAESYQQLASCINNSYRRLKLKRILLAIILILIATATCGYAQFNSLGLTITGNPASTNGATFSYVSTDDGVQYNIAGNLQKPPTGSGPWPGIIVNHGDTGIPRDMADFYDNSSTGLSLVRDKGMVVIAPCLTHSRSQSPCNISILPNESQNIGACTSNSQIIGKMLDILNYLGYVNMTRIAIHGHSAGAGATIAALDMWNGHFKAASHTGGANCAGSQCPTISERNAIDTPYSLNHGCADTTAPVADEQSLYNYFVSNGRPANVQLRWYDGTGVPLTTCGCSPNCTSDTHAESHQDPAMIKNVINWYTTYGVYSVTNNVPSPPRNLTPQ
jgi:dienelactone hydrolase